MVALPCSGLGHHFARGSPADGIKGRLLLHRPAAAVDEWRDLRVYHLHRPSPYPFLKVRRKGIDRPQGAGVTFC